MRLMVSVVVMTAAMALAGAGEAAPINVMVGGPDTVQGNGKNKGQGGNSGGGQTGGLADCQIAHVTISTLCQRVTENNDSAAQMNGFADGLGVFGVNNWMLADKAGGDEGPGLTAPYALVAGTGSFGTWSVQSFGGYEYAALVLKGGSLSWVAYLLDLENLSGNWSTQDLVNGGGNQADLSHMSLYVGGTRADAPPAAVPLPATGALFLGALAGLFGLRRRKA